MVLETCAYVPTNRHKIKITQEILKFNYEINLNRKINFYRSNYLTKSSTIFPPFIILNILGNKNYFLSMKFLALCLNVLQVAFKFLFDGTNEEIFFCGRVNRFLWILHRSANE